MKKISFMITLFFLFINMAAVRTYAVEEQSTELALQDEICLDGTAECLDQDNICYEPLLQQREDGTWTLSMYKNTTVKIQYTCKEGDPVLLQAVGVQGVVTVIEDREGMIVTAAEAGTGVVAFQSYKKNKRVGDPLAIAVIVLEDPKPEELAAGYYAESVFVGDSIMLGCRNYVMRQQNSFLSGIRFLAAGSYSFRSALSMNGEKKFHPLYQGKQSPVWESISKMEHVKRVFIFLGMNDLNVLGLDGTCSAYQEFVDKIKEHNPDVEIHIFSMTYTLKGQGTHNFSNDKIREYNDLLKQTAEEKDWGYIDIATPLADEEGNLSAVYCSDGFIHHSRVAYDVWKQVLLDYCMGTCGSAAETDTEVSEQPAEIK